MYHARLLSTVSQYCGNHRQLALHACAQKFVRIVYFTRSRTYSLLTGIGISSLEMISVVFCVLSGEG